MNAMAVMDKDELLIELCQTLLRDPEVVGAGGWRKIVMAGAVEAGSAWMHGFSFDAQGDWEAAAPRRSGALDLMRRLRDAMADSDGTGRRWVSCLLRIDAAGHVDADFEYDDPDRWKVTPANHAERVREFAAMPVKQG